MKMTIATVLIILATFGACVGAAAQSQTLKADIPFAFTVGRTFLPAGEYTISSPLSGVVHVSNDDRRLAAMVTTFPGDHSHDSQVKLVFNKYGSEYFLHRILSPLSSGINVEIPAGVQEKKARLREARLESSGQALVAAK